MHAVGFPSRRVAAFRSYCPESGLVQVVADVADRVGPAALAATPDAAGVVRAGVVAPEARV
jgi:hypothetical protein